MIIYILPYHHYLNPIEEYFNQLKHYIKLDKPLEFEDIKRSIEKSINNLEIELEKIKKIKCKQNYY